MTIAKSPPIRGQAIFHLVHGTWGRGLIPKRPGRHRKGVPFWYERRSQFFEKLTQNLGISTQSIKSRPVLWSGANSIAARDVGARRLLKSLDRAERLHPKSKHFIIAHSHGGNVALRALQLAEEQGILPRELRIITLATPFLRIFGANKLVLGKMTAGIALYLSYAIYFLVAAVLHFRFADAAEPMQWKVGLPIALMCTIAAIILSNLLATKSVRLLDNEHQLKLARLSSYAVSENGSPKCLIVRGVDDEASLVLAFSSIVAKASSITTNIAVGRLGILVFWGPLFFLLTLILLGLIVQNIPEGSALQFVRVSYFSIVIWLSGTPLDYNVVVSWVIWLLTKFMFFYPFILVSLILLVTMAKGVFGRELWIGSLGMDVAADSTPDLKGLSEVITLLPASNNRALRHFIYNYPDCPAVVAQWIAKQ